MQILLRIFKIDNKTLSVSITSFIIISNFLKIESVIKLDDKLKKKINNTTQHSFDFKFPGYIFIKQHKYKISKVTVIIVNDIFNCFS